MGGEEDTSGLGGDQALDHHSQAQSLEADVAPRPVADGARRPQRGPAAPDRIEHLVDAFDVEVGLLLTGKGRLGQVLCRR